MPFVRGSVIGTPHWCLVKLPVPPACSPRSLKGVGGSTHPTTVLTAFTMPVITLLLLT